MPIRFTYTIEEHAEMLARRIAELDALEEKECNGEREDARSRRCNSLKEDFAACRDLIRRAFVRLRRLGAGFPPERLGPALVSLAAGDTRAADLLLGEIEGGTEDRSERAGAAAMRGRIAEAEVRWRDAARHYAAAARLAPVEANLTNATRMAVKLVDTETFDHFASLRIAKARAELPESSPERDAILEDVLLGSRCIPSTLDADGLWQETVGKRMRQAGLDTPKGFADGLLRHLGGDPAIDVSLTFGMRYREGRRRMLRLRGRAECRVDYATALVDLARASLWTGRRRMGVILAWGAVAVRTAELGEAHPATFDALYVVAILTGVVRGPVEAERVSRDALALRLRVFGKRHRAYAEGLAHLAFHLDRQDRYEEAARAYRSAVLVLRRLAPLDKEDSDLLAGIRKAQSGMHRFRRTPNFWNCRNRLVKVRPLDLTRSGEGVSTGEGKEPALQVTRPH